MTAPRSPQEREALGCERAECARVMGDEVLAIEKGFAPLEEEVMLLHIQLADLEAPPDTLAPLSTDEERANP